jgi:hypothetical protein
VSLLERIDVANALDFRGALDIFSVWMTWIPFSLATARDERIPERQAIAR